MTDTALLVYVLCWKRSGDHGVENWGKVAGLRRSLLPLRDQWKPRHFGPEEHNIWGISGLRIAVADVVGRLPGYLVMASPRHPGVYVCKALVSELWIKVVAEDKRSTFGSRRHDRAVATCSHLVIKICLESRSKDTLRSE